MAQALCHDLLDNGIQVNPMVDEESEFVDDFIMKSSFDRDEDIHHGYDLLKRYPHNAELWLRCGHLIEMSKSGTFQTDEARHCYERVIHLQPDHFKGYEHLGDWERVRCDDARTAIGLYRRAIELGNEDSSRIELAIALASLGTKAEALRELESCRNKHDSDYVETKRNIADGLHDPYPTPEAGA